MDEFSRIEGISSVIKMYKVLDTDYYVKNYVDVDYFASLCKECPNYGTRWSCPPFNFDVMEKYWNNYKFFHIFGFKMFVDQNATEFSNENKISEIIPGILQHNYEMISKWILDLEGKNKDSAALTLDGGYCFKCKCCAKTKGKQCRHLKRIRPAIDAIGGNVCKTSEDLFNTKILWIENGRAPEYFMFVVGLLSNNNIIIQ